MTDAPMETLFVYQDMTARDLLQRRATDEFGATTWTDTPLTGDRWADRYAEPMDFNIQLRIERIRIQLADDLASACKIVLPK